MSRKLTKAEKQKRYKRKAALAMYEANYSMGQIQRELGHITVKDIRQWSIEESTNKKKGSQDKCSRPKCIKRAEGELDGVKYCRRCLRKQKRKRLNEAKTANKQKKKKSYEGWKNRVFAGWKDTPEQAAIRRSPEYQQWRIKVLERDKYTCQHCEVTGGKLVVHHVKTFKMHEDLRFDPDNGIVLCNDCHEKLHLSRVKRPKILKVG